MDERLPLFGPFALDVARGCLLRAGDPVHLRPQSYRVLEYLVRHRGRLVGKDALIEHVWQGRAVGDDSLVQCLRDVRLALDDAGARVVRTIRGRGYIFEPPAQPVPLAAEPNTPSRVPVEADEPAERGAAAIDAPRHTSTSPTPPPSRWALPRSTAAIATLLAVAAAAMAYVLLARPSARSAAFDSVAVLPFVNESTDADSEYLADGGTESLINTLAQVQGLSVKPRSAVFRFRGTDLPPQRLAEELSVDAIVYGRVVREGPQLTVSMSLVDGRTGNQLWGERYTQELTALAAMQHEIAVDVARKLQRRLIGSDAATLASGYTPAADAYLLYLRGRYHNQRSNEGDMRTAIDFYGRAVDADPQYALAHAGLAEAYRALSIVGEAPSSEAFPRARSAALRALALDDRLAEAHIALGWITFSYDWNWTAAERELQRAIELSPASSDAHRAYGHLLSNQGRHGEAVLEGSRARELEPRSLIANALEAQFLFYAGKLEDAERRYRKTLEIEPDYWVAHQGLGRAFLAREMLPEAIQAFTRARELSRGATEAVTQLGYALARSGKRAAAEGVLAELSAAPSGRYIPAYTFAMIHSGLVHREEALRALEQSVDQREVQATFLKVDTRWDWLRTEPRFVRLLKRLNLG